MQQWLSTSDIAAALSLKRSTVAAMIRRGDFGPLGDAWCVLGREYRVTAEAFDRWQAAKMGQPVRSQAAGRSTFRSKIDLHYYRDVVLFLHTDLDRYSKE